MSDNFPIAIEVVLKHEGGFCNDAADPGGATNFGVSLYWLKSIGDLDGDGVVEGDLNHDGRVDVSDILVMTRDQAKDFYKRLWWDHYGYGRFVSCLIATKVFDMAVNMGGLQAHKLLQRACAPCGVALACDGILGTNTIAAVQSIDARELYKKLCDKQELFYRDLVVRKPKLAKFLNGWVARAHDASLARAAGC